MSKIGRVFIQGIGLGLGVGLCLAGALALVFRSVHGVGPQDQPGNYNIYFLVVGAVMGLLGGWCLSLHLVLNQLLSSLFLQISLLVPMTTSLIGREWADKMEIFFKEVLSPLPAFFGRAVKFFLVRRFENYPRINRAISKAKKKQNLPAYSPEWMARVVLHYFLEPLWVFFYAAYTILFLIALLFLSFPFAREGWR